MAVLRRSAAEVLVLGRAVLLQVCHPTIGAGVEEHSEYREDPWTRLLKALLPIIDTVYAADGAEVGARIREAHRNIRGVDEHGRRYHAWEPEAYWFVLASGLDCMIVMSELYFDAPIRGQDRERMLAEVREVGLRMGLRERDMAVGWTAFSEWYETTLVERARRSPGGAGGGRVGFEPGARALRGGGRVAERPGLLGVRWTRDDARHGRVTAPICAGSLELGLVAPPGARAPIACVGRSWDVSLGSRARALCACGPSRVSS